MPRAARRVSFFPQLLLSVAVGAGLYLWFTLPPKSVSLPSTNQDARVVYGAYHIHTKRSDGTGTPDEVAAAAARAGLQFVVLTDHGDGTRTPDAPAYRHGVLTIDAAEISSAGGHIVALGMTGTSPYPMAGEARDVIEDVHRLGGWTVAAHPDSPRPDFRWRTSGIGSYDALEWLNLDSEWRDERPARLFGTVGRYFLRGPETIASLIARPTQSLRRWDAATRTRNVPAFAALDAHARLPLRTSRDTQDRTLAALPTYVQIFRTLAQAAVLERAWTGNADIDAGLLLDALRRGRAFSAVTAFGSPAQLSFTARQGSRTFEMGESLDATASSTFSASVNDSSARLSLIHNGIEIASGRGRVEFSGAPATGAYRVEAYRPTSSVPWIVSNPIYGPRAVSPAMPATDRPDALRFASLPGDAGWAIERSPTSSGTFAAQNGATTFSFGLGPGVAFDQFAALVATIGASLASEGFDRVRFTVSADRPLRFSVQLRLPPNSRWRHSIYADTTPRTVELFLEDFQPADGPSSQRPIVARIRNVMFVVDTLNAFPGTTGTIRLSDVELGVGNPHR